MDYDALSKVYVSYTLRALNNMFYFYDFVQPTPNTSPTLPTADFSIASTAEQHKCSHLPVIFAYYTLKKKIPEVSRFCLWFKRNFQTKYLSFYFAIFLNCCVMYMYICKIAKLVHNLLESTFTSEILIRF